ncbi:MAG: hypothetical protein J5850_00720, partial [Clostridia bacterium]|nr:hypothetical protein [Clostridia bacterium]
VGAKMKNAALSAIEILYDAYSDDIAGNFLIWPVLGKSFYPIPPSISSIKSYKGNVDQLKNWITERYEFLSEEWKNS